MKKKRMQERATEQEKIQARRMQAGQVSFKAAAEKRVSSHGSAHASSHVSSHVLLTKAAAHGQLAPPPPFRCSFLHTRIRLLTILLNPKP